MKCMIMNNAYHSELSTKHTETISEKCEKVCVQLALPIAACQ